MGCACALGRDREDLSCEDFVRMYEEGLGWKTCSISDFAKELELSGPGDLTTRQLHQLLSKLRIRVPSFHDSQSPITTLYFCFKTGKRYSRSKLCVLCVLLSCGSADGKIQLLETAYALDESTVDTAAAVEDLCEVALVLLPMYASMELEFVKDTGSVAKMSKYQEKLRRSKGAALRQLRVRIGGHDPVPKAHFRSLFLSKDLHCLLSASALRLFSTSLQPPVAPIKVNSILKSSATPTPVAANGRSVRFLHEEPVTR